MIISRDIKERSEWLGWRKDNINASEAACLLGDFHPYMTAYKLWAIKSGLYADDADSPEKRRGRLLEPVAINLLQEERPDWQCRQPGTYFCDNETRIGATPDVLAYRDDFTALTTELGVVQIKVAGKFAFQKNWVDHETGEVETPLWIKVQATVEAHLAQAKWAAVAVMTIGDGGLGFHIEEIPLYPPIISKLEDASVEFWGRVASKTPYPVDYFKDGETLLSVYKDDDGSTIDLSNDEDFRALLYDREFYKLTEKRGEEARKQRRGIDARIIGRMGNASRASVGTMTVDAKTVRKKSYTVPATQFRMVKVKGDDHSAAAEAPKEIAAD
jgi:predicted phage-related endonuclease